MDSLFILALFHLVNNAFYKTLLLLGAESVIHAVADNQDFRRYGGLRSFLPLTYSHYNGGEEDIHQNCLNGRRHEQEQLGHQDRSCNHPAVSSEPV